LPADILAVVCSKERMIVKVLDECPEGVGTRVQMV
jgi:hypothetical protein